MAAMHRGGVWKLISLLMFGVSFLLSYLRVRRTAGRPAYYSSEAQLAKEFVERLASAFSFIKALENLLLDFVGDALILSLLGRRRRCRWCLRASNSVGRIEEEMTGKFDARGNWKLEDWKIGRIEQLKGKSVGGKGFILLEESTLHCSGQPRMLKPKLN